MVIDDPAAARKLARAVCSDVTLYNDSRIKALPPNVRGQAIAEAVAEGRALYESRVAPGLVGLFDEALQELVVQRLGIEDPIPVVPPPVPKAMAEPGYAEPPVREARARSTSPAGIVMAVLILLVSAGMAFYVFVMR